MIWVVGLSHFKDERNCPENTKDRIDDMWLHPAASDHSISSLLLSVFLHPGYSVPILFSLYSSLHFLLFPLLVTQFCDCWDFIPCFMSSGLAKQVMLITEVTNMSPKTCPFSSLSSLLSSAPSVGFPQRLALLCAFSLSPML